MELEDCAFPLVKSLSISDEPEIAFKDADYAVLIGARPRGKGMERADLLQANAKIFIEQGKALNNVAHDNTKILVVGNPANTNAYIAMKSAPNIPRKNFTAMLRLDHNRALSQLSQKANSDVNSISGLVVWEITHPLCTLIFDILKLMVNLQKKLFLIVNGTKIILYLQLLKEEQLLLMQEVYPLQHQLQMLQ